MTKKYPVIDQINELTTMTDRHQITDIYRLTGRIHAIQDAIDLLENEIFFSLHGLQATQDRQDVAAQLTGQVLSAISYRYKQKDPDLKVATLIANMNEEQQ